MLFLTCGDLGLAVGTHSGQGLRTEYPGKILITLFEFYYVFAGSSVTCSGDTGPVYVSALLPSLGQELHSQGQEEQGRSESHSRGRGEDCN